MVDILNIKNDIVKALFYINLISLIVLIINVILGGTCVIITKWVDKFKSQFSKMWGGK